MTHEQIHVHTINGARKVVEVLTRDTNGGPLTATIRDGRALTSIIVHKERSGEWKPVSAVRDGVDLELPPCFRLNRDSQAALELTD